MFKVILLAASVTFLSPCSSSFELSGRILQKTRIEPLRSSMALWRRFRRWSASTMCSSGTPAAMAVVMHSPSFSLATRKASRSVMSTVRLSASVDLMAAINRSFSSSCFSCSSALLYSAASRPTSFASSMAFFRTSIEGFSQAWASFSLAFCLGSSSFRTLFAFFDLLAVDASLLCLLNRRLQALYISLFHGLFQKGLDLVAPLQLPEQLLELGELVLFQARGLGLRERLLQLLRGGPLFKGLQLVSSLLLRQLLRQHLPRLFQDTLWHRRLLGLSDGLLQPAHIALRDGLL
mmetsp:Transcript_17765/g.62261  ORF Transcript_17765/g.62261 Transcript_17765/m.62261 type:complete len:292 (+) Transcript_17765:994-1869(+)